MADKIYRIEKEDSWGSFFSGWYRYRMVSLYNGVKGPWQNSREQAVKDGETHQGIIEDLKKHGIELR